MAIRIHHQPTGFSLGAAYVMGAGRRQERRRKYALDMWQRDRYLNARFGGMGGRGSRRLSDEEPGGRWVDPLDKLGGPATPGQLRTQKAQLRRAARRHHRQTHRRRCDRSLHVGQGRSRRRRARPTRTH